MKLCRDCASAFRLPDSPAYARCRKSEADAQDDASLAGEMRKVGGICGPEATLWEEKAP
jgi:hypothetical protein